MERSLDMIVGLLAIMKAGGGFLFTRNDNLGFDMSLRHDV